MLGLCYAYSLAEVTHLYKIMFFRVYGEYTQIPVATILIYTLAFYKESGIQPYIKIRM